MMHEQVQALNYCAHAIEDLREQESEWRVAMPESARVLGRLIDMLRDSVKFILPNCCNLLDPYDLRQAHLDLLHLPFPCVAFEAPWNKEGEVEQLSEFLPQAAATKRIALCWEARPEYEVLPRLYSVLDVFPDGGVFVAPIYWGPAQGRWVVTMGGSFVPYKNTVRDVNVEGSLPATRLAQTALFDAGQVKRRAKQFNSEPFYLLPEFYQQVVAMYGGNVEKAYAQIILDSRDEVQTVVQACSVINCANVITSEIGAPLALNKKRQENGKQPFFSYKVLQLSDERRESAKSGAGGTHASPRMHLRRGHLRQLEDKVVWVRPAMVNAGTNTGAVLKDYAVQATPWSTSDSPSTNE